MTPPPPSIIERLFNANCCCCWCPASATTASSTAFGIENKRNQCSLNAVDQLLRHFSPFREMIALKAAKASPRGPTTGIPAKLVKGMIFSTTKSREASSPGEEPGSRLRDLNCCAGDPCLENAATPRKGSAHIRRASHLEEVPQFAAWGESKVRPSIRVGGS